MRCLATILLICFLQYCEINGNIFKNCEFNNKLTSDSFKYRCDKATFDEHCEIPDDIVQPNYDKVTYLKITDCPLKSVEKSYKRYKNLKTLDLSNSSYDSLNSFDLNHASLVFLNLSHNKLRKIPQNFFINTPKIKEIDFSSNKIEEIDEHSFKNVTKLERINLSHNLLSDIVWLSYEFARNLQFVDMSHNEINYLTEAVYNNSKLAELNLENNSIGTFDNRFFVKRNGTVYLSWEFVEELYAIGEGNEIEIIRNSQIEGLINKPGKFELHLNGKHGLNNLQTFLACNNKVKNLTEFLSILNPSTFSTLELFDHNFGRIEIDTFEKFNNLEYLSLTQANLTEFNFDALANLKKLTFLDLSGNKFKTTENIEVLKSFTKMTLFKIEYNQLNNTIEVIDNLSETLNIIGVAGNYIGHLKPETFARFSKLERLNLSDTSLLTFDFNPFVRLKKLFNLDLSKNNLNNQNFEIISATLNHLTQLNIAECHLRNVKNVVKLLGSLILNDLELSGNFIRDEDLSIFIDVVDGMEVKRFPNMIRLKLDNTNLTTFNATHLQYVDHILAVDLSNNYLKSMNFSTISNGIEYLYLNGNELFEIHEFHRSNLPRLRVLTIGNNQFSCEYIKEFIQEWKGDIYDDPLNQKQGTCTNELETSV